ncbi:bifunctional phosphopantothenoylcysteine decarboxylase/phosphopantothenate--cysteine ligase CoaBC [Phycicoccus sp. BSK3Z-2]|uniref:Coenzyme A biosynthesis bifunctional protein CoaBC n=1 Tax=Phycicoccus avicenniae TaxID=2828860 RepID=A0A941D593_9MICO|nr:bifunctional phosphopantothenoylcysteine decarboxylase/phosphopantothenate--cysteine ligase CoaBC [Phycicoccus avicenniae]MBR7742135.1 bifunctional phosphopantothenoylcysteine decarboxylase/phosphopantothenate--cysteine ligase CoaBC [Phycicoccus avicenniae]
MRVVLGVAGGIAAYKACSLLRLLTEAGHDVTVVPTAAALRFVGEATWSALSGKRVHTDVWSDITEVPHVRIGQEADLVVVAPATADLLARAATGQADDLLTNVLLTARCPVVMAPAMHTEMFEHPATQANIETLTERGVHVVPPASGRLTGKDSGPGRLPEPETLYEVCRRELERTRGAGTLAGRRVVVSAGGTREPLDPVRFLGNRSSGKQGYALAAVAAERGAEVTLVSTADLATPDGVAVVPVETAREMEDAVRSAAASADVVVMAAAVADFRPADVAEHKIKKSHGPGPDGAPDESVPALTLVRNPDVLAGLVASRRGDGGPVLVGFAAETGDEDGSVLDHGRAKLERKGCDVLVVNEVGGGKAFGTDDNTVHVLRRGSGDVVDVGPATKSAVAAAVWDVVTDLL